MSDLDLTLDPKSLCGEGRNGNFPPAIKFTFVLTKHTQEKPNVDSNGKKMQMLFMGYLMRQEWVKYVGLIIKPEQIKPLFSFRLMSQIV